MALGSACSSFIAVNEREVHISNIQTKIIRIKQLKIGILPFIKPRLRKQIHNHRVKFWSVEEFEIEIRIPKQAIITSKERHLIHVESFGLGEC